jgi:hypothetical protein
VVERSFCSSGDKGGGGTMVRTLELSLAATKWTLERSPLGVREEEKNCTLGIMGATGSGSRCNSGLA